VHDPLMPNYSWSCLSCGQTNTSQTERCTLCACPANATAKQINSSRARHVAEGGVLQPGAAESSAAGLSAYDVLVRPLIFLLLGWSPMLTPDAKPGP
jgi:hypothetical protein